MTIHFALLSIHPKTQLFMLPKTALQLAVTCFWAVAAGRCVLLDYDKNHISRTPPCSYLLVML